MYMANTPVLSAPISLRDIIILWYHDRKSINKHDDVIKWKHFPRYWPFMRAIHRSPMNSPHKGQWRGALVFSNFIEGCCRARVQLTTVQNSLDNELTPDSRQAIIWTNDGLVYWWMYVSVCLDELNKFTWFFYAIHFLFSNPSVHYPTQVSIILYWFVCSAFNFELNRESTLIYRM